MTAKKLKEFGSRGQDGTKFEKKVHVRTVVSEVTQRAKRTLYDPVCTFYHRYLKGKFSCSKIRAIPCDSQRYITDGHGSF